MVPTKRIEYIDAMRGLTMVLVVYNHFAFLSFDNETLGFNDIFMRFRMPIFFFISGWLFFNAKRIWDKITIIDVLKKKFMVQIIPFIVFFLLFLYVFDIFSIDSFGSSKQGYWFTLALFEYFVLYILLAALFQKDSSSGRGEFKVFFFALLLSIASFYYSKYYTRYAEELGNVKGVLGFIGFVQIRYFIFFWFGTFVKKHFEKFIEVTDNPYFMALILTAFVAMNVCPSIYSIEYGVEYLASLLTALGGIIIVFTFFRKHAALFSKDQVLGRVLQFTGRRTLDIYLLHYFFLPHHALNLKMLLNLGENAFCDSIVLLGLSMLMVAFCLLISEIIRLSPFLAHYLFGVKYTTTAQ